MVSISLGGVGPLANDLERSMRIAFITCLIGCLALPAAQAQEIGRVGDVIAEGNPSYHVFARPGEPTVQVSVVGTVRASGIYEVGTGTDLGQLLTLTGSLAVEPRTQRQRQEVTIRLYRNQSAHRDLAYEASLSQFLQEPGQYPELQDGDVVEIETVQRAKFSWRDGLTIISSASVLALAIDRIIRSLD